MSDNRNRENQQREVGVTGGARFVPSMSGWLDRSDFCHASARLLAVGHRAHWSSLGHRDR